MECGVQNVENSVEKVKKPMIMGQVNVENSVEKVKTRQAVYYAYVHIGIFQTVFIVHSA